MTPSPDPKSLGLAARRAVEAASREALEVFRGDLGLEHKADGSPVTLADKNAERAILAIVREADPEASILAEESGAAIGKGRGRWIVDPLDGLSVISRYQYEYPMGSRPGLLVAWLTVWLATMSGFARTSSAADQPLAEAGLTALLDLKIGDDAIIARIKKAGVSFAADEAALKRLVDKGASEAVIKAIREAGAKPPASPPAGAITYADVLKLLQLDIPEEQILKRLAKSPSVFTFSTEQVAELKGAGAAESLIKALQAPREVSPAAAEWIWATS